MRLMRTLCFTFTLFPETVLLVCVVRYC